jgi:hypothetical protein
VRVRIFNPLYPKAPHLDALPFSEGARRMSARVVSFRLFLRARDQTGP